MSNTISEYTKFLPWDRMPDWLAKISTILLVFIIIFACAEGKKEKVTGMRIISLAPHITEIIYAIDAAEELVAVTDFCNYPEEAKKKPKIGGLLNPNIEKILRLKPTHLFGVPAHASLNHELQKFGLSVSMMANETISDVIYSIEKIGKETGHEAQAKQLITGINDSLAKLKADVHSLAAMLIIGREKGTLRNVTVTGSNTFIDEIWQLVGGRNIFADLPARYSSVNLEEILIRDPDIIIELEMDGVAGVYRQEILPEWAILEGIKALKNGNLFLVRGSHTMIPGPRMVLLAKDFHNIIEQATNPDSQKIRYIP